MLNVKRDVLHNGDWHQKEACWNRFSGSGSKLNDVLCDGMGSISLASMAQMNTDMKD